MDSSLTVSEQIEWPQQSCRIETSVLFSLFALFTPHSILCRFRETSYELKELRQQTDWLVNSERIAGWLLGWAVLTLYVGGYELRELKAERLLCSCAVLLTYTSYTNSLTSCYVQCLYACFVCVLNAIIAMCCARNIRLWDGFHPLLSSRTVSQSRSTHSQPRPILSLCFHSTLSSRTILTEWNGMGRKRRGRAERMSVT